MTNARCVRPALRWVMIRGSYENCPFLLGLFCALGSSKPVVVRPNIPAIVTPSRTCYL